MSTILETAVQLAMAELKKEHGEDAKLQDGEEFATVFNDGVLILGLENKTLKVNILAGKPYKVDFDLNLLDKRKIAECADTTTLSKELLAEIKEKLEVRLAKYPYNDINITITSDIVLNYLDYDFRSEYEELEDNETDSIAKVYCTFTCMGLDIDLEFEKKSQIDEFVVCYDKLSESEAYLHFEKTIALCQELFRIIRNALDSSINIAMLPQIYGATRKQ